MLILFHYFGLLIFQILENRKRLKSSELLEISSDVDLLDLEYDLKFDPPVYRQRYSKVYEILSEENWRNNVKKLIDFGCAEYGLFIYLKNLNLEKIFFVDIDEYLLEEKIGKLEPLLMEQLRRRSTPLEVYSFKGSVTDPDYRLGETDVVTAIELIEHLYPDTLDAFPYNVFSFIKPKLVIITTPNADFNVMFNRMEGFRHPDHKFEWSREQFEAWALNITQRFPDYTVEFTGIGEGPCHSEDVGCCSQGAIFTKNNMLCPVRNRSCLCDSMSPCKGLSFSSKLLCKCICEYCLPDFSVGVCTYHSCNVNHTNFKSESEETSQNNIFYKLIQKIEYPYEIDLRPESEKLMQAFEYRIRSFSYLNSRFYVEDKGRCEIPILQILYGDIGVGAKEARHLLSDAGYQIEECIIPETQESEFCIISTPQEMEDITSSSEVTDGYSSKNSECNENTKFEVSTEPLLDLEGTGYSPKEEKLSEQGPTLTPKQNADPLFDSGYLKSPSPLEASQHLPSLENAESVETDHFEVLDSTPSMQSDDNKLHLKKSVAKEKFAGYLMALPESYKTKVDPNKVNELDRFHNMNNIRTFTKPQSDFKWGPSRDAPIAGTSSSWRKNKKFKDKVGKKDSPPERTVLDDAKSLTNVIIQNSLNIIDVPPQLELIQDLSPLHEPPKADEILQEEHPEEPQQALAPLQAVENGDLANNNRDNEGNNMEVNNVQDQDIDEGIDLLNDNLEELGPLVEDNANAIENNNEEGGAPPIQDDVANPVGAEAEALVAEASREVLYDANSEQDLLEDFDIPPHASDLFDVILIGVQPASSSGTRMVQLPVAASIETNTNSFPDWLLHILGTHVGPEDATTATSLSHDEPHFYCQGDGLGVHPSVIAVEGDEAEDADNDTTSEDSSTTGNTGDFAEVDPGPSDLNDQSSLPEESSPAVSMMDDNTLRMIGSVTSAVPEKPEERPADSSSYIEVPGCSSAVPKIAETAAVSSNSSNLENRVGNSAIEEDSAGSEFDIEHDVEGKKKSDDSK